MDCAGLKVMKKYFLEYVHWFVVWAAQGSTHYQVAGFVYLTDLL